MNNGSRKESKEINRNTSNTDDAMNALDSSITTAEEVLNTSNDPDTIQSAHENLMASITNAQTARTDAYGKKETASNTKRNIETQKQTKENECNGLKNEKATLTNQLNELKGQDTSNMTDEQKTALKKQISELETQIKQKDKDIEKVQKQINEYAQQIAVQQQIIDNNTALIASLDANIRTGNTLSNRLASKSGVAQ